MSDIAYCRMHGNFWSGYPKCPNCPPPADELTALRERLAERDKELALHKTLVSKRDEQLYSTQLELDALAADARRLPDVEVVSARHLSDKAKQLIQNPAVAVYAAIDTALEQKS